MDVHIHEADADGGWGSCELCTGEIDRVGLPTGTTPVSVVLTKLTDLGNALKAGDFSGWRVEIVGLRLARPAAATPIAYPHFDDGKTFIQVWRRRVRKDGVPCFLEERWHPEHGQESVLLNVMSANREQILTALQGRRLLEQLRVGRPPGTVYETDPDAIRAAYHNVYKRMRHRPTQFEVATELGMSLETFKRRLRELRESAGFRWRDLHASS